MKSFVLAEFGSEEAILAAARALRAKGHAAVDLHSPVPIHGAEEALGLRKSRVPIVALVGGVSGAALGYLLQWWTVAVDWPLNVGGRPPHSAPAFIPVTFELGVLVASLSIFLGLLFGFFAFPRTYHPVFEVEGFRSASIDGLWLSTEVDATSAEGAAGDLRAMGARQVSIVREALR
jgi:hypothetical protein